MKKYCLLTLCGLISAVSLCAQNIFPSSGNVGIGTNNPYVLFHINTSISKTTTTGNAAGSNIASFLSTNDVNAPFGLRTMIFGANAISGRYVTLQTTDFDLVDGGNIVLQPAAGNVGIGTNAPADRLDVNISNNEPKNVGFYTTPSASGDNPTNSPIGGLRFSWYNTNFADIQMLRGYDASDGLGLAFLTSTANNSTTTERMRITTDGKVAIGTTDPKGYQLAVNGSAVATSVTVKLNGSWPDYVFHPAYQLRPLQEVQSYIDQNQHLPEMPSEKEIKDKGIDLGEIVKLQTKKIEELTLYLIEKDKQVKDQQTQLNQQKEEANAQKAEINELKQKLERLITDLSKNK